MALQPEPLTLEDQCPARLGPDHREGNVPADVPVFDIVPERTPVMTFLLHNVKRAIAVPYRCTSGRAAVSR